LELTLDKRLSGGTQFSLGYTWSQSIDDATELFGSEGGIVQDIRNLGGDRGNSGFDRRPRFAGSYVWGLPFGTGHRWLSDGGGVVDALLGGWRLSGIVSAQFGQYFDVTISDPTSLLGVTNSVWRPDLVGEPRRLCGAAEPRRYLPFRKSRPQFAGGSGIPEHRREPDEKLPVEGWTPRAIPVGGLQRHQSSIVWLAGLEPAQPGFRDHPEHREHATADAVRTEVHFLIGAKFHSGRTPGVREVRISSAMRRNPPNRPRPASSRGA